MHTREQRDVEVQRLFHKKAWYRLTSRIEKWGSEDPEWLESVLFELGWARIHGPDATSAKAFRRACGELRQAMDAAPDRVSVVEFEHFAVCEIPSSGELEAYLALLEGRRHAAAGRWKEAADCARRATELDPTCFAAHHWHGRYAREAGDEERASAAFARDEAIRAAR